MLLVEAFAAGDEGVEVVTDQSGGSCFALHPGVSLDLIERNSLFRVLLCQADKQVEEAQVGFEAAVGHGSDRIPVQTPVVLIV